MERAARRAARQAGSSNKADTGKQEENLRAEEGPEKESLVSVFHQGTGSVAELPWAT